ncbi:hypothetical protein Tco_1225716 [Tanacetum coccineum]
MRNEPKLSPSQTGYGPEGSKTDERFPEDTSAVMHGPKPNKTIRRRNGPKLSPGQTDYGPKGSKMDERFPEDTSAEGWEEEEGVCPPAQTATTSASTGDIQKRSQKVKTTKEGIRNQDQRRRNQVGRRMTYPSHGYVKT